MTDDLVQWFGAQLDDDERIARAATPGPWWHNPNKQWLGPDAFEKYDLRQGEEFVGYGGPHPFTGAVCATGPANDPQGMNDATFIAAHDPARVLREIDAKRQVLRNLEQAEFTLSKAEEGTPPYDLLTGAVNTLRRTVRALALPYAVRPGYREAWRP